MYRIKIWNPIGPKLKWCFFFVLQLSLPNPLKKSLEIYRKLDCVKSNKNINATKYCSDKTKTRSHTTINNYIYYHHNNETLLDSDLSEPKIALQENGHTNIMCDSTVFFDDALDITYFDQLWFRYCFAISSAKKSLTIVDTLLWSSFSNTVFSFQ